MVFVSNLNVMVSGSKVLLTWENPVDFNDHVTIYKSDEIIDSAEKLGKAVKIAVLKHKEDKYVDEIKEGTNFYAAMITGKTSGKDQLVFIPYRNFTAISAEINELEAGEGNFEITRCSSSSNRTSVIIEWDYKSSSLGIAKAVIYRNLEPITDEKKLDSSIKLTSLSIDSRIYVDVPITGINYYYAIFIENRKDKKFIPDVSYTTNPVLIEKKETSIDDFSSDNFIPLPLLTLQNDPTNGKRFSDPQILKNPQRIDYNAALSRIIESLRKDNRDKYDTVLSENKKKAGKLEFRFLSDEDIFDAKDYSSEYSNVLGLLKKKDFKNALDIINEMIYETIPEDIASRIAYYAGLIYYSEEDYYRSYLYLILSYDDYQKDVSPFIDSIYFIVFPTLDR